MAYHKSRRRMLRKTLLWTDLPPCREAPDFKCVTPRQVMALPPSTPAMQVIVMPSYCLWRWQVSRQVRPHGTKTPWQIDHGKTCSCIATGWVAPLFMTAEVVSAGSNLHSEGQHQGAERLGGF